MTALQVLKRPAFRGANVLTLGCDAFLDHVHWYQRTLPPDLAYAFPPSGPDLQHLRTLFCVPSEAAVESSLAAAYQARAEQVRARALHRMGSNGNVMAARTGALARRQTDGWAQQRW
jgi:hypothetical protein